MNSRLAFNSEQRTGEETEMRIPAAILLGLALALGGCGDDDGDDDDERPGVTQQEDDDDD
jgi:hypothetical protein